MTSMIGIILIVIGVIIFFKFVGVALRLGMAIVILLGLYLLFAPLLGLPALQF